MTVWLAVAFIGGVVVAVVLGQSRRAKPLPRSTLRQALGRRGAGTGIDWLLSQRPAAELPDEHPARFLLGEAVGADGEPLVTSALLLLDRALRTISSSTHANSPWIASRLSQLWSTDLSAAGGALSEIEAFGTMLDVFPTCVPVPETKTPTPDFSVPGLFALEIYRPRESVPNKANVQADLASQKGPVKIAVSYPITGSDGSSREFPASKVIDRIVGAKRASKQTLGAPGVLYVDLRHEWNVASELLQPVVTVASKGEYWIGTFGAWHAFYGALSRHTMLKERATLRFLSEHDVHAQLREGLFREARHWAAAILASADGIVIFQNPWSSHPLSEDALRGLLRLYGLRAELSWYEANDDLAVRVEATLNRLEWTLQPVS